MRISRKIYIKYIHTYYKRNKRDEEKEDEERTNSKQQKETERKQCVRFSNKSSLFSSLIDINLVVTCVTLLI